VICVCSPLTVLRSLRLSHSSTGSWIWISVIHYISFSPLVVFLDGDGPWWHIIDIHVDTRSRQCATYLNDHTGIFYMLRNYEMKYMFRKSYEYQIRNKIYSLPQKVMRLVIFCDCERTATDIDLD
jgi:hypothetical protein